MDFLKEDMERFQINTKIIFNSVWTLAMLPLQIWLWMAMLPFRVIHWMLWGEDLVSKGKAKGFVPIVSHQVISPIREEKKEIANGTAQIPYAKFEKKELPSYQDRVSELIKQEEFQSLDPRTRQVLVEMITSSSSFSPMQTSAIPSARQWHAQVEVAPIKEKSFEELVDGFYLLKEFERPQQFQKAQRPHIAEARHKKLERHLKTDEERYPTLIPVDREDGKKEGKKEEKKPRTSAKFEVEHERERYPTLYQTPKEEEKEKEVISKQPEEAKQSEVTVSEVELINRKREKKKERKKEKQRESVRDRVEKMMNDIVSSLNWSAEHKSHVVQEYTKQFERNIIGAEKLASQYPFLVEAHPNDANLAWNKMNKWETNLFHDMKKDEANNLRQAHQNEIISTDLDQINLSIKRIKEQKVATQERKTFDKVLDEVTVSESKQGKQAPQTEFQISAQSSEPLQQETRNQVVHAI